MATLQQQKVQLRDAIFETAGVRHREIWRTEAEDGIVSCLLALSHALPAHQLRQVGELLKWHAIHLKGESRSSLIAMVDEEGGDGDRTE